MSCYWWVKINWITYDKSRNTHARKKSTKYFLDCLPAWLCFGITFLCRFMGNCFEYTHIKHHAVRSRESSKMCLAWVAQGNTFGAKYEVQSHEVAGANAPSLSKDNLRYNCGDGQFLLEIKLLRFAQKRQKRYNDNDKFGWHPSRCQPNNNAIDWRLE